MELREEIKRNRISILCTEISDEIASIKQQTISEGSIHIEYLLKLIEQLQLNMKDK
jgi:hypothetical protein